MLFSARGYHPRQYDGSGQGRCQSHLNLKFFLFLFFNNPLNSAISQIDARINDMASVRSESSFERITSVIFIVILWFDAAEGRKFQGS